MRIVHSLQRFTFLAGVTLAVMLSALSTAYPATQDAAVQSEAGFNFPGDPQVLENSATDKKTDSQIFLHKRGGDLGYTLDFVSNERSKHVTEASRNNSSHEPPEGHGTGLIPIQLIDPTDRVDKT